MKFANQPAITDFFERLRAFQPELTGKQINHAPPTQTRRAACRIAAIPYERGDPIEELMATAAKTLRDTAIRVGGLVQHNLRMGETGRCQIELENILTGTRYRLTQNLGSESQSCSLDISALAEASCALRQAIDIRVDLMIVNKFGTQEAGGGGLRDEIMQIAMAGIPLLTAVGQRYLSAWQNFVGEEGVLLQLSLPEVLSWWQHVRAATSLDATGGRTTKLA